MESLRYIFIRESMNSIILIDLLDFSKRKVDFSEYINLCLELSKMDYSWVSYMDSIYEIKFIGSLLFIYRSTLDDFRLALYKNSCLRCLYTYKSASYRHIKFHQVLDICSVDNNYIFLCIYFNPSDEVYKVKRLCLCINDNCIEEQFKDKDWKDVSILLNNL